jgi:hypothetical protein
MSEVRGSGSFLSVRDQGPPTTSRPPNFGCRPEKVPTVSGCPDWFVTTTPAQGRERHC